MPGVSDVLSSKEQAALLAALLDLQELEACLSLPANNLAVG